MITILTPTYNRATTLPRLFNSLIDQTSHDFEWLIIDDGSSDDSAALITEYQQSAPFDIRYIKKNNGGKHTALNLGFEEATKEWIFIVDSDDWLDNGCLKNISNYIEETPNNYHSISFLKKNEKGEVIGDRFTDNLCTYLDKMYSNISGDKADVIQKSALEGFHFPEYSGENFMAESPLFLWLANKGYTKFINYPGYICEYRSGGLSDMSVMNRYRCINSTLFVYETQYKQLDKLSLKVKASINWWRFRLPKPLVRIPHKVPMIYMPLGALMMLKDFLRGFVKTSS